MIPLSVNQISVNQGVLQEITPPSEALEDYVALLKPRVMSLVIFTAICGLLMAPGSLHPVLSVVAILCIAVGAGAAGCLNMWYDRDIDTIMSRTQSRPIPQGRILPENALAFGVVLSGASVLVMGVAIHWVAAGYLALTIGFYVFIYTMWLKRSTPQNIVIGGAAGAFPPLIGWVAVTGHAHVEAWVLFAIIFLWTPPHFWALALFRHEDYRKANVPMLPVVSGIPATKRQIVFYSILMVLSTLLPWYIDMASGVYGIVALVLGAIFIGLSLRIWRYGVPKQAMQLFGYSIIYLFVIFLALTVDRIL